MRGGCELALNGSSRLAALPASKFESLEAHFLPFFRGMHFTEELGVTAQRCKCIFPAGKRDLPIPFCQRRFGGNADGADASGGIFFPGLVAVWQRELKTCLPSLVSHPLSQWIDLR